VSLLDSDVVAHVFTFTVQAVAPFKLVSVAMREPHGVGARRLSSLSR